MKDLDFDELDRAVNSVIGGNQGQTDDAKEDTGVSATASVSDAADTGSDSSTSVPSVATSALQPPAARRSTGRFMDVVHPSSDMRSNFVPSRSSTRDGVTIQPPAPSNVEEPVLSSPTPSPVALVETVATEFVKSEWPDPIDYNKSFGQSETEESGKPVTDEALLPPVNDTTPTTTDDAMPPLESPFIADAKVEKRPLGAFADAPPTETESVEAPVSGSDIDLGTNVEDTPNEETPMPAELQDNLLLIESNEDTAEAPAPEQPVSPVVTLSDVQATVNEAIQPVAITQQYVEQPSTGDKPAGSIFDVDSYHKPIAHPKKKKSGWLMIVWIVLLIIFGIGAGAVFYFYILPTL